MLFGRTSQNDQVDRVEALERENERLRQAVGELSLLNELAMDVGTASDLDTITKHIVRRSIRAVQAEQGVITLVEEREGKAPLKTLVRTVMGSREHPSLRPDQHLMGWMQAHREPLLINNPHEDERFAFVPWPPALRSVLCVPLTVRSRLIAMLTVYNKQDGQGFTPENERLLAIIASQTAQVIENARLYEEEKKLLRVQEELRLAYDIQTNLLPQEAPALAGYDIAGRSAPAQTVGGDYYDFIELAPGRWALCVGDAVGKGLPAALLAANVQATLRGQARPDWGAGANLERANQLLSRSIQAGEFVTLFYGCLNAHDHRFSFANAGHNRPLWIRSDGSLVQLEHGGLVLGAVEHQSYPEDGIVLDAGDWLLIYSDGLVEAMNTRGEPFALKRVEEMLQAHRDDTAAQFGDRLIAAVQQHSDGEPQTDDITLIAIRRL